MSCYKRFGRLQRFDHPPALMDADRKTAEWHEFRPEQLPEIFSTYRPICRDCHITEAFRRVHPELVVDRHRDVHNAM